MRTPNHIVLDFEYKKSSSIVWNKTFLNQKTFEIQNSVSGYLNRKVNLNFKNTPIRKNQEQHTLLFKNNYLKISSSNTKVSALNYWILVSDIDFNVVKFYLNPGTNAVINNLVNVNFLRKERLYTKLKYSRSPAYDMVSGGAAALFAAFLGFLVSEKYGFELADSGDFYYLFMYIVFLSFSIKPLITSINHKQNFFVIFSIAHFFNFYKSIFLFLLRKIK